MLSITSRGRRNRTSRSFIPACFAGVIRMIPLEQRTLTSSVVFQRNSNYIGVHSQAFGCYVASDDRDGASMADLQLPDTLSDPYPYTGAATTITSTVNEVHDGNDGGSGGPVIQVTVDHMNQEAISRAGSFTSSDGSAARGDLSWSLVDSDTGQNLNVNVEIKGTLYLWVCPPAQNSGMTCSGGPELHFHSDEVDANWDGDDLIVSYQTTHGVVTEDHTEFGDGGTHTVLVNFDAIVSTGIEHVAYNSQWITDFSGIGTPNSVEHLQYTYSIESASVV